MTTSSPAFCPSCATIIPPANIHVAQNFALCRSCGMMSTISLLRYQSETRAVDLNVPPRHIQIGHDDGTDLLLTYRRRSPVLLALLVPFTALWGGMTVGKLYVQPLLAGHLPNAQEILFSLPFLLGTAILLALIAYLLWGRWDIRLTGSEGAVFTGVGSLGRTRRFRLDGSSSITLANNGAAVNDQPVPCIRIQTGDDTCAFGAFIHEDSKRWLAARLSRHAQRQ